MDNLCNLTFHTLTLLLRRAATEDWVADNLDDHMINGKQYVVVAVGAAGYPAEYLAYRLPN